MYRNVHMYICIKNQNYLCKKDIHSNINLLVVSTPRVSEPQCSRPYLEYFLKISNLSELDISINFFSFISVNIHGFINAPRPMVMPYIEVYAS